MVYYRTNRTKQRNNEQMGPVDSKANMLFDEAKRRYQSAYLDAYMAGSYADFEKVKQQTEELCVKEAREETEARYQSLKLVPAMLIQDLEKEIFS